jgi:RNA polymerase sigma-70 factor, ECF subfamily
VSTRSERLVPRDDLPDAGLLAEVRAKQSWASDVLIARHLPMMNRLAYRLVGVADLDDVVQESVFLALRALPKLRHADALTTWFASIVVSVARKAHRRRRLLARLGFVDASPIEWQELSSPTAPPDVVAELKAVCAAVDRLPAKSRVALILRRVERRPLDEIATIMGASLASVKRWIAAAEQKLAEEMARRRTP